MQYAKEYNISRAVMYDNEKDSGNPMFDLNRQLIKEDKDVIVISSENTVKIVENIFNLQTILNSKNLIQTSLL